MPAIRLPGLLTGIDTTTLIAQLMAIERRQLNIYEERKKSWTDREDALNTLETKLSTLQSSLRGLYDADKLRAFSVASSDSDIITAEASYNAYEGNHTIVINQLATAERWVHTSGLEYPEDYVGEGTFIYSYNHKEAVITTTATTTLEDLVGLINNDADNPGVTATLLYYNDSYHLMLNGNDAGTDHEIYINSSSTEVWQADSELTYNSDNATLSTKIVDLDQFSGTLGGGEHIEITGTDHSGTPIAQVDLNVTENTTVGHLVSEINDAFDGIAKAVFENGKIVLTDDTCGSSSLSINLAWDDNGSGATLSLPTMAVLTEGGSTTANLAGFAPADFTETQSAQNSQIRVDGYPAANWIERSSNTIDDVISGVTLHLHDTTDANGEQITLTRNIDAVKEKLSAMITAYNSAVTFIKEKTGYNEILGTGGVLMGDYVISGIRSQLLTPLIAQTSGFVSDFDTFLMPGQIGLQLDRDGVLNLDTAAFDEAIAQDYMGVLAIIGADKTGSSDSNTIKFYGASGEYTTAGTYDVEVQINASNEITSAKIRLSTESTWRDATWSGNTVTGDSSFDDNGDPVYPENGLQLSVDLSQDGTFAATVRVKQGFAGDMEDALDRMLKASSGSIQIDQEHVEDQIENLQDRIDDEQDRLARKEEQLVRQFARLESTLALMQNQLAILGLNTF
jgi:flagellar capping protein FliD